MFPVDFDIVDKDALTARLKCIEFNYMEYNFHFFASVMMPFSGYLVLEVVRIVVIQV